MLVMTIPMNQQKLRHLRRCSKSYLNTLWSASGWFRWHFLVGRTRMTRVEEKYHVILLGIEKHLQKKMEISTTTFLYHTKVPKNSQATKKHIWWFAAGNARFVQSSSRSRFVRSKSWTFAMLWWFLVVSPPPWRSSLARMRSLDKWKWRRRTREYLEILMDLSPNMESRVNISNWFVNSSIKRY